MKRFGALTAALFASMFASLAGVAPADAHPHVFVDAKAEIVFDAEGRVAAVRNIWQFDDAFTAFAIQGLDANNDGKLSDAELKPLAKVNVDSLKEYDFFTWLIFGKKKHAFQPPKEYWLEFHDARLTLFFTLPLATPVAIHGRATVEIFDPEYFVAFTFVKDNPVTLDSAPAGCHASYRPPQPLDTRTMNALAAIPVDQHDLPPDLVEAASALANLITLDCAGGSDTVAGGASSGQPPSADNLTAADRSATAAVEEMANAPAGQVAADQPAPVLKIETADNRAPADSAPPAAATPAPQGDAVPATGGRGEIVFIGVALAAAALVALAAFFLQRRLKRAR